MPPVRAGLKARAKPPKTITPIRPNEGLAVAYQRKLESLVDDLNGSLLYWLRSAYRANEPIAITANDAARILNPIIELYDDPDLVPLAMDASPARELQGTMRRLSRRWQRNFDKGAPDLAAWFSQNSAERTDAALREVLKRAGFSVAFKMTDAARDVVNATTFENVSLIRSIAQQHLAKVEGVVMRSVAQGRDLKTLTDELEEQFAITRRRAVLIARDQTNKAHATIEKTRQREIGVTEAIWCHSRGGKHPRASHVAFDGKRYDINAGALIDGKRIWPGTEIWCRCYSKAVLPGFD